MIKPAVKTFDRACERKLATQQTQSGPRQLQAIDKTFPARWRCGEEQRNDFIGQRLFHPHHLLHKAAVQAETREERQDAIPVEQVVIDMAVDITQ